MNEIGLGNVAKQFEIPSHMNRLEGRINDLAGRLDELNKRLGPVLRDSGEVSLKKDMGERPTILTPLAAQIEHNTGLLDILIEKLHTMIDAIEL